MCFLLLVSFSLAQSKAPTWKLNTKWNFKLNILFRNSSASSEYNNVPALDSNVHM